MPRRRSTALRFAIAGCALGLGAPALRAETADASSDFAGGGLYGSLALGYARNTFATGDFGSAFDDSTGFDARAGYRATRHLAGEFQLELHTFDFRQSAAGGAPSNDSLDTMAWTANLKGFLPSGRWQPYALLGAGLLSNDGSGVSVSQNDVGAALRFGAGVDAYLTRSFALTAGLSYLLPFGTVSDFDYYSFTAGIQYTLRLSD